MCVNELKEELKTKIHYCMGCINNNSTRQEDMHEATAVYHLSNALYLLSQIKED